PISGLLLEDVGTITQLSLRSVFPDEDVLEDRLFRIDELSVRAIELPQDADLADVEGELAPVHVDEHALIDFIEIERFTRRMLEIPGELSAIRAQCERGRRVEREIGAGGAA